MYTYSSRYTYMLSEFTALKPCGNVDNILLCLCYIYLDKSEINTKYISVINFDLSWEVLCYKYQPSAHSSVCVYVQTCRHQRTYLKILQNEKVKINYKVL